MLKLHTPPFCTIKGLMQTLSVSRSTAYDLVRYGEIRSVHIGRLYLIPRDAIIDFVGRRIYGMRDNVLDNMRYEQKEQAYLPVAGSAVPNPYSARNYPDTAIDAASTYAAIISSGGRDDDAKGDMDGEGTGSPPG